MTSISNLEMAKALSSHPHVTIKRVFFSFIQRAIYQPTLSTIDVHIQDYTSEMGAKWEKILNTPEAQLKEVIKQVGEIQKADISNMRLEACISRDRQFLALQLFRFVDFQYHPMTEARFFEGEQVKLFESLL